MNNEELKSFIAKLDIYIGKNIKIELPRYNAFGGDDLSERLSSKHIFEKLPLPDLKIFTGILEHMIKELGLESRENEVYETALMDKAKWEELKDSGCIILQEHFYSAAAIGFALIQKDINLKNEKLILNPEERMNILLYAGYGAGYVYKIENVYQVIDFCLKEKLFALEEVNQVLKYKGFPLLPYGKAP